MKLLILKFLKYEHEYEYKSFFRRQGNDLNKLI